MKSNANNKPYAISVVTMTSHCRSPQPYRFLGQEKRRELKKS